MHTDRDVAVLRAFNRTYTRKVGLLDAYLGQCDFTLTETRIMYEIVTRRDPIAAEIGRALDLDRAQISRTLKRLVDRGIVETRDDPSHGRIQLLSLTEQGRAAYDVLEVATKQGIGELLDGLPDFQRHQLLSAARTITSVFEAPHSPEVELRALRIGEMGLIIQRQAVLYAEEHGYDARYEALIARILADYAEAFDPARDAGWVAEMDGRLVGSVFLIHTERAEVGRLRLLYVEPDARGAGVGRLLVTTCIERARKAGYRRLDLWTDKVLSAARSIYESLGFKLVAEAPDHFFGTESISQTWSLPLAQADTISS